MEVRLAFTLGTGPQRVNRRKSRRTPTTRPRQLPGALIRRQSGLARPLSQTAQCDCSVSSARRCSSTPARTMPPPRTTRAGSTTMARFATHSAISPTSRSRAARALASPSVRANSCEAVIASPSSAFVHVSTPRPPIRSSRAASPGLWPASALTCGRDVRDLSRRAVCAFQQVPTCNDASGETGPEVDVQAFGDATQCAPDHLGSRCRLDVVHHDRAEAREPKTKRRGYTKLRPTFHGGCKIDSGLAGDSVGGYRHRDWSPASGTVPQPKFRRANRALVRVLARRPRLDS